MKESLEDIIGKSLEADRRILPWLPFLLQDLWALGSSPEIIISLVKPLGLPETTTTLVDLGCGKGAVSVMAAKTLGFSVTGVDACRAFLESAREKAVEFGVASRCTFIEADIRDYVLQKDVSFDIAVYASLGDVLGDYDSIIGHLRRLVRPGGYIIIDDGFLKTPEGLNRPGYEHCRSRDEVLALLLSRGDTLIREVLLPDEENKTINDGYLQAIRKRSALLLRDHPELTEAVKTYVDNQAVECAVIEQHLTGAIWLFQRGKT